VCRSIPLILDPRGSIEHRSDSQQPARLRSTGLGNNREFDETAPEERLDFTHLLQEFDYLMASPNKIARPRPRQTGEVSRGNRAGRRLRKD
jgi:hypothetical protein